MPPISTSRSCDSDQLSYPLLRTSKKSAALPDCRLCAASLMNLLLMPTSASAPPRDPEAAPMAAPVRGIRRIIPINAPQNVPEAAPGVHRDHLLDYRRGALRDRQGGWVHRSGNLFRQETRSAPLCGCAVESCHAQFALMIWRCPQPRARA
jgi:hypothetical protein